MYIHIAIICIESKRRESAMIESAEKYEYPIGGQYNETVALLADGRTVTVNTQYTCVVPHGNHAEDCDQINVMGGRCTCGLLDGIDVPALVADARINGKRGYAPRPTTVNNEITDARRERNGLCPRCDSCCHGDCDH